MYGVLARQSWSGVLGQTYSIGGVDLWGCPLTAFTDGSGEDSIPTEAGAGGVGESKSGSDVDDDEDEDAEAAYLDTKVLGDADHLVCDFQFFS